SLGGSSYRVVSPFSAEATIEDDPPIVTITAGPGASELGPVSSYFTLTRTGGDLTQALTVYFDVGGTATATAGDADYTGITFDGDSGQGTVTFDAGSDTATVDIVPITDDLAEGPEDVVLTLDSRPEIIYPLTYEVGTPGSATLTIEDACPTVTIE